MKKHEVEVKWINADGNELFSMFVYVYRPQNAIVFALENLDSRTYELVQHATEVHTQVTPPQR